MAKKKKIINIEDSMGKHWAINRALRWNGYPVADLAVNGETGIAMIEQAAFDGVPYDLLITDMHFPVNGADNTEAGLFVIKELKRRGIQLPVIVCSSLNYKIPEAAGCVCYNKRRDLNWDFKEVLDKIE